MAGLGIAQHPDCLGLPVKDPLNMKSQLNTTAGDIQEQETKSALHGPCTSLKHGNHFCTCHTCAVKEGVTRARDKEGRKNLCWKELRWCARQDVHAWTCKKQQRTRSKPKKEIKLFFIIIYYKKCNMPGFYGSFYGH